MLCSDLKFFVGIKGPLNSMSLLSAVGGNDVLASVLAPKRHFVISEATVASFQKDTSIDSSSDLAGLEEQSRKSVSKTVGNLFLTIFVKKLTLRPDPVSSNATFENIFQPVLPWLMYNMRPEDFFKVVKVRNVAHTTCHAAS